MKRFRHTQRETIAPPADAPVPIVLHLHMAAPVMHLRCEACLPRPGLDPRYAEKQRAATVGQDDSRYIGVVTVYRQTFREARVGKRPDGTKVSIERDQDCHVGACDQCGQAYIVLPPPAPPDPAG